MHLLSLLVGEVKPRPVFFVGIGYFDTLVISEKGAGLSSTMRPETKRHQPVRDAGVLTEKSLRELAEYVFSDNPLEVSIGMAAINASISIPAEFVEKNARDIIIEKGKGKTVGIIGHFPFVNEVKNRVGKLYVFEKSPKEGDITENKIPELLSQCDVVAITGMSIMNGSFEFVLEHTRNDAFKIVLGPSTPLTPRLFEMGIDAVSGTIVENPQIVKKYVLEGAPFKHIKGIKLITIFR